MSRPRKMTDDKLPRLIEVARIRLEAEVVLATAPVTKQLAGELDVSPKYLHNVMHRLTTILRASPNVSRETLRRSLYNDKEFRRLMDGLNARAQAKVKVITLHAEI